MERIEINCRICDSPIVFPEDQNTMECSFCHRMNERPKSTGKELVDMRRADDLRRQCYFEEAARHYENILEKHPDEHAALWGKLMCKYGVEPIEEKRFGRLISRKLICHRARNSSIRNEFDFKEACRLADPAVRAGYEEDAEYIDNVQAYIREVASKKAPYDIFICYKETDLEDPRKQTRDSVIASQLCNRFKKDGYRVFFAPYSLQEMTGENYEAEIFHAINTAKVMFVLGLKPEHFTATWPRSEWSRFMELMEDRSTILKPLFGDSMRAEELPREFLNMGLQGFNIDYRLSYLEDLSFELYKIFQRHSPEPSPQMKTEKIVDPPKAEPTRDTPQNNNNPYFESPQELLEQGMMYYQDGPSQNLAKAVSCFTQASSSLSEAQRMLGECYEKGKGVTEDLNQAFKFYYDAALRGNLNAQCDVGHCYEFAIGTDRNLVQATTWYKRASSQGHARAQFRLAACYKFGNGVTKDVPKAMELYHKSAEQGYVEAQYLLAAYYFSGIDVVKNAATAVQWCRKAAEQGHADAQCNLGVCYDIGKGVAKDPVEAVKWYRKATEQGHARAQYNLGVCYYNGKGVAKDPVEAVKWYRKAAEQGYADAQCNLGVCYDIGKGVAEDPAEAVKWYRKAAEQGHARAQYNLGVCYELGKGVNKDPVEAVKWYRKAAEQGHADAQYNLADCYHNGNGVKRKGAEAAKWYRKAAEQGHADAQYELGECYYYAFGVERNEAEAVNWYRKAAEQGHAEAQFKLGECYEKGEGVPKDLNEAVKWYREAADQEHYDAMDRLEELEELQNAGQSTEKPAPSTQKNGAKDFQSEYNRAKQLGFSANQLYWLCMQHSNDPIAQATLGECYELGKGVAQDLNNALVWYSRAANKGILGMQAKVDQIKAQLGYRAPSPAPAQENEPVSFQEKFRRLHAQGAGDAELFKLCMEHDTVADAQAVLGDCYAKGRGVAKDVYKAFSWYSKGAENGHKIAQYNLAVCYHYGMGHQKDLDKAEYWYQKAADQGHVGALSTLTQLREQKKQSQEKGGWFQKLFKK